ncbi:MAG: alpha/beta fold hydrolase [Promethearchaeota archaeon]
MITIPIFSYDGIDINYIKEGEGEPLVFLSGTFTKLQSWIFQIDFFKDKMMVIALDNRGAGKSSRPDYPYTMEMFVNDLKNLLDYLNIDKDIHLCGLSMGGMIAQKFVLKHPNMVKTLTLCATGSQYFSKTCDQNLLYYKQLMELDLEKRVEATLPNMYSRAFRKRLGENRDLYEKIKKNMNFLAHTKEPPLYKDYINQNEALRNFDIRELLPKIIQPTLIISGSKDRMSIPGMAEFMCENIPNSKLEILNGLGHGLTIEDPETVNNIIWNFIQENLG